MTNHKDIITWASVNNLVPIVTIIVSIALACGVYQTKIQAMEEKGIKLRNEYEQSVIEINNKLDYLVETTQVMKIDQAKMQKDIEYIKAQL